MLLWKFQPMPLISLYSTIQGRKVLTHYQEYILSCLSLQSWQKTGAVRVYVIRGHGVDHHHLHPQGPGDPADHPVHAGQTGHPQLLRHYLHLLRRAVPHSGQERGHGRRQHVRQGRWHHLPVHQHDGGHLDTITSHHLWNLGSNRRFSHSFSARNARENSSRKYRRWWELW